MASRGFSIFLTLILVILFGVSLYFLYLNLPALPGENVNRGQFNSTGGFNGASQIVNYTSSKQFYPNMRYKDRLISYNIEAICDEEKTRDVEEAMAILEQKTTLNFYKSNYNSELNVLCSEIQPEAEIAEHFVAGEGGPVEVINTSLYAVILAGKISFYRNDRCDKPLIAIHEILHSLGFDHNNNPRSILYPTLDCNQEIDDSIIEDINRIYSIEGLPDLKIIKVDASKSGAYLNFDIEVLNQGLEDVQGAKLSIFADGDFVKDFVLGDISIGVKKILQVENLKISRSTSQVEFVVDKDNAIAEISKENNVVKLTLQ